MRCGVGGVPTGEGWGGRGLPRGSGKGWLGGARARGGPRASVPGVVGARAPDVVFNTYKKKKNGVF